MILSVASLAALAVVGCRCCREVVQPVATAASPDGRNEIRLWTEPLAYEVRRDGVAVVAKSEIGMKVGGKCLVRSAKCLVQREAKSGFIETPVYKKARVDLKGNETVADFGEWAIRLAARDDGVAYRFETKMAGRIRVDGETAEVNIADTEARACFYRTDLFGCEENVPTVGRIGGLNHEGKGHGMVYLPLVYSTGGKTVAVTDADVRDYPVWYLKRGASEGGVRLDSVFAGWPKRTRRSASWDPKESVESGGRWVRVDEHADHLVETEGTRTFPWRLFVLCDEPKGLCESDAVYALSTPRAGYDFSWVRPGKVAWDWWNCFDNQGEAGCNTKTYERFIDFAAKSGVEYVILDEGWSKALDIWNFHPNVDVPHLIRYADAKGVGIILWMAWAQAVGDEERVAEHFAKLGAKGFKVDFMDRGDAACERFLWTFADACARNRMLVDYHGAHRPTGLSRAYPNVVNYEGVHGLEQMKWYFGDYDILRNDVAAFFGRLTAGPMDYTPGAMDNYPVGRYPKVKAKNVWEDDIYIRPGSLGTRARQMAMMVLYEAPLQMLADSPTKYERNGECFSFMASVPTVWDETVGLGGAPDSFAAVARRKGDVWYAAAISNAEARDVDVDTSFLGGGLWQMDIFRDASDADTMPTHYVRETRWVDDGEAVKVHLSRGGGFLARFVRRK